MPTEERAEEEEQYITNIPYGEGKYDKVVREAQAAIPQHKPHEVKEGAVLPGQTYEKYKSMEPKDFEEWMKAAPDIDDHPYGHLFDPEWFSEFKEHQRVENPEFWARYLEPDLDYRNRLIAEDPEEWKKGGWKTYPTPELGPEFDYINKNWDYPEYLEKRKLKEREIPDPSKLLT